jgi:hypothetical protein
MKELYAGPVLTGIYFSKVKITIQFNYFDWNVIGILYNNILFVDFSKPRKKHFCFQNKNELFLLSGTYSTCDDLAMFDAKLNFSTG